VKVTRNVTARKARELWSPVTDFSNVECSTSAKATRRLYTTPARVSTALRPNSARKSFVVFLSAAISRDFSTDRAEHSVQKRKIVLDERAALEIKANNKPRSANL
jgi:hypothetical protein